MEKPLVSVCCVTYNHEKYIKKCLDSILEQQIDFKYEIVIYDDASTDSTKTILSEYSKSHSDLFKIHYSPVNYYSQGPNIWLKHAAIDHLQRARGNFIALLDGDDFWTNSNKLSIQVQAMTINNSFDLCFHPAQRVNEKSELISTDSQHSDQIRLFSTKEVIESGGGFIPTSSILFRREVLDTDLMECLSYAVVGDSPIQIYGSTRGGALYLPWAMSAYRVGDKDSWSQRIKSDPLEYINVQLDENKYYHYLIKSLPQYSKILKQKIIRNNISTIATLNNMLTD